MTKLFYPYPNRGKSKALIKMSHNKARRFVEIITGQNNLHNIQNKVNQLDLLCRFCEEEEETFDHLLFGNTEKRNECCKKKGNSQLEYANPY